MKYKLERDRSSAPKVDDKLAFRLLCEEIKNKGSEFARSPEIEKLADIMELCYGIGMRMGLNPIELEGVRKLRYVREGGFIDGRASQLNEKE